MAEGDLERRARRLDGFTIEGRPVFARLITNTDLERKDELDDEAAETRLELTALEHQVDECEDPEERRELRRQARELTARYRNQDTLMLSLYIEDEHGERFPDEQLLTLPFRVAAKLSKKASEYAFGVEDEEARPTTGRNESG
jgi:hypothetical protein